MSELFSTARYKSITTPGVYHDDANMLVELLFLNRDISVGEFPWKGKGGREWGKLVAAIKRLIRDFDIMPDQLAFYIFKCSPQDISSDEFAKMAVVAKKLLRNFDLEELCTIYQDRRDASESSVVSNASYKTEVSKSLTDFLKELENA
jgi:hypothetical protein